MNSLELKTHLKKYAVFLLFIGLGCQQKTQMEDVHQLQGYWQIDKVKLSDGSEKVYNFSPLVDFFAVDSISGYRKKVQPQFDGSFNTSQTEENFKIVKEDDKIFLHYKTELAEWKEEILSLSEKQLVLKNQEGSHYFYKPFEKIVLD